MLNFGSISLCFHLLYFLVYVQPLMQDSIVYGHFMAYAHTSVISWVPSTIITRGSTITPLQIVFWSKSCFIISCWTKKKEQEAVMRNGALVKWHAEAFFRKKEGSKLFKSQPFLSFFINNLCFIANHHHLFIRLISREAAFLCFIETTWFLKLGFGVFLFCFCCGFFA